LQSVARAAVVAASIALEISVVVSVVHGCAGIATTTIALAGLGSLLTVAESEEA
jgi:hypothetical protein